MDCRTARLLLPFARPGGEELERADQLALEQHLAECPDCRLEVEAERTLDGVFAHAMRTVPIPAGLRTRLLTKLTGQRRRYYVRWAARGCAAAALLLVTFLWFYRAFPDKIEQIIVRRTEPDAIIIPTVAPEPLGPFRSLKHMLDHIRAQGCAAGLPRDLSDNWNFQLLEYASVETYNGKPTPTLGFKKGAATAKVRLLGWGQYDAATLDAIRAAGGRIVGNQQRDPFIAVVELSPDARIEDFSRPKQTVA